jgi:hypothetical protein
MAVDATQDTVQNWADEFRRPATTTTSPLPRTGGAPPSR